MSLVYTAPPAVGESSSSAIGSTKRNSLYLGGKADAKSRSKLDSWGVTHILNVTPEKDVGIQNGFFFC